MVMLRMLAFRPAAVIDIGTDPGNLRLAPKPSVPQVELGGDDSVKKPREAPVTPAPQRALAKPPAAAAKAVQSSLAASLAADLEAKIEPKPQPESEPEAEPKLTAKERAKPQAIESLTSQSWNLLLDELPLSGMVLNIASHCEFARREGTELHFLLDQANASLFNDGHVETIRRALENYFGSSLSVSIEKGVPQGETPSMQSTRLVEERQAQAVVEIERDVQLQQLIERFDGELDRNSIVPLDT